jgi:hypothetical protein
LHLRRRQHEAAETSPRHGKTHAPEGNGTEQEPTDMRHNLDAEHLSVGSLVCQAETAFMFSTL